MLMSARRRVSKHANNAAAARARAPRPNYTSAMEGVLLVNSLQKQEGSRCTGPGRLSGRAGFHTSLGFAGLSMKNYGSSPTRLRA
jgi:hypothetical protein